MDYFTELQPWHWIILTFLILGMEALGAGGFLLGAAVASLMQALILWIAPDMSWAAQISIFGASTLVFTICWWFFFRKSGQNTEEPLLNNRAAQQVGRIFVLESDLPGGHGRVQLGDTMWKVTASETLHTGTTVIVSGAEGMTLLLDVHDPV